MRNVKSAIAVAFMFMGLAWNSSASASCAIDDASWSSTEGGCKDLVGKLVFSIDGIIATNNNLLSQAAAKSYCANLVEGGMSDWRLPTLAEATEAVGHDSGTHIALAGTPGAHFLWWTSDIKGTKFGFGQDLRSGESQQVTLKSSFLYYICVRQGS